MPRSQVSFNTSRVQNTHHIIKAKNMMLATLPSLRSLASIMAMANKTISNASLGNETGMGI